ncbi:uncharacterized protein LOC119288938 [Triticum dicoccoides]|uniref:uncharacterized protein LOC119288938 n=1 Tax=Triticum dicoccoides TaxID=85692 RepID=UPI00188F9B6B|nr:uncharacterized protein LOC119288938 [Triticum dicoccoides]
MQRHGGLQPELASVTATESPPHLHGSVGSWPSSSLPDLIPLPRPKPRPRRIRRLAKYLAREHLHGAEELLHAASAPVHFASAVSSTTPWPRPSKLGAPSPPARRRIDPAGNGHTGDLLRRDPAPPPPYSVRRRLRKPCAPSAGARCPVCLDPRPDPSTPGELRLPFPSLRPLKSRLAVPLLRARRDKSTAAVRGSWAR